MKTKLNKLFRKLGYVPYDKLAETLAQLAYESLRRDGDVMNYAGEYGLRLRVSAETLQTRINKRVKSYVKNHD